MVVIKAFNQDFVKASNPSDPNEDNIKIGDQFRIVDEVNLTPKFKSEGYYGTIETASGEKLWLNFGQTVLGRCRKAWGQETKGWIDKMIVYQGYEKMGAMQGKSFYPLEEK